ncbi:hypothetical protein T03_8439 [Trichinella britovi]|uniref:Uncharacterized protein n=1 Tax=Trichinella britovi TaxID=45882 RepID=A0A0V1AI80_TRIBR|nr:hypothetical protein T03_8439 [Trichinella britovi]
MISIPENNFYHYSIFYCTKVTLYQVRRTYNNNNKQHISERH